MRATAVLVALLLSACSSGDDEVAVPVSPCQEAAECVVEECRDLEFVVGCLEVDAGDDDVGELSTILCFDAAARLHQCGAGECDAGEDAVGEALTLTTDVYGGMVCER